VPRALLLALLCLVSALGGYGLARLSVQPAHPEVAREPGVTSGERWMELLQVRRIALDLTATPDVRPQLAEAEMLLRNRLAEMGWVVAGAGEEADATLVGRLDAHHFRAFDVHGVTAELHLERGHRVTVDGQVRLIPHDIWQADATRLVRSDAIPREVLQCLDELVLHLHGALRRARVGQR
jgi:hypothetical protein